MRPTLTEIESELLGIEDEQFILSTRVTSLKSMLAKYVEAHNNGKSRVSKK
jgi:hypothetical protein